MSTAIPMQSEEAGRIAGLQQTVSASRLSLFLQCRLRFFFRYVAQIERSKTPALHVGSSVHGVLKAWNKARWRKVSLTTEQLQEEFQRVWIDEDYAQVDWKDNEEHKHRAVAWSLLETYLRETPIPHDAAPEAVEVPVEADLSTHGLPKLVGILDLVQNGTIVEFKTSSSTPDPLRAAHQHELQLTAYAMLYREATGRPEAGLQLHTLVKLKTPKLVITYMQSASSQQEERLLRQIESYVSGLECCDWIPSPGLHCGGCEYFQECRQWH